MSLRRLIMSASSQEIQPRSYEQRPTFIETIDRTGRVGILEDGTWSVGWRQSGGEIVWHKHQDVWRVFRQNERVIQRFLGIPLETQEEQEVKTDPNLDISLPNLRETLVIFGEMQKAQQLTQEITNIMTLSVNRRTSSEEVATGLNQLRNRLSPNVRNEFKMLARQKLTEASEAQRIAEIHISTTEAFDALLLRAREGMSIVSSLFRRGTLVLDWVDKQEKTIEVLRNAVGAALREIKIAQTRGTVVGPQAVEAWQSRFGGQTDVLNPVFAIRGNPYSQLVKRAQITRLNGLSELIESRDIGLIERRLENAYPILEQVLTDRKDREASGAFDRYRTKQ